ncbi:MAG TPA: phosphohydrolase [Patescibacteria group bacterium]|nr:phosphohydrolase [Patescibacteria group bacterium]
MDQTAPQSIPQPSAIFNRDEAYKILTKYLKNPNLIKHCLAAEAVMRALYRHFYLNTPEYSSAGEEKWGITGLLHDADYDLCKGQPEIHGVLLIDKEGDKIPEDIAYAIKAHNYERTLILPKSLLDWSIACCDQLTGLIVAATLVSPEKKINKVTVDFIMNRYKERSFAKGADRKSIEKCEEKLNIPLTEFVAIALEAMQSISSELGL